MCLSVIAVDDDRAFVRTEETHDHFDDRRLTRAVRAEKTEDLSGEKIERDVVNGFLFAECLRHVHYLKSWLFLLFGHYVLLRFLSFYCSMFITLLVTLTSFHSPSCFKNVRVSSDVNTSESMVSSSFLYSIVVCVFTTTVAEPL